MQSSNGAKYWKSEEGLDCKSLVLIHHLVSQNLSLWAKVDSLVLWNLHPRHHLKLTYTHRAGSLNELISDSSFEGLFQHKQVSFVFTYLILVANVLACLDSYCKALDKPYTYYCCTWIKTQEISTITTQSQCFSVMEWEHTCRRKMVENVFMCVHVRLN